MTKPGPRDRPPVRRTRWTSDIAPAEFEGTTGRMLALVHNGEIEISEGPASPREGPLQ
jgi:hypothetical protein